MLTKVTKLKEYCCGFCESITAHYETCHKLCCDTGWFITFGRFIIKFTFMCFLSFGSILVIFVSIFHQTCCLFSQSRWHHSSANLYCCFCQWLIPQCCQHSSPAKLKTDYIKHLHQIHSLWIATYFTVHLFDDYLMDITVCKILFSKVLF